MGRKLTTRLKIVNGESLLSYIYRSANANGMNHFALINLLRKSKYQLHARNLNRIDYYPENILDFEKVLILTGLTKKEVFQASFSNVLIKLKGNSKEEDSMILSGMLREKLHYCADCLSEKNKHFELFWKINGIDTCTKHNALLNNSCLYCSCEILIKDVYEIGICPYCHSDLSKSKTNSKYVTEAKLEEQRHLKLNFSILINENNDVCLDEKEVAVRLLFILNSQTSVLNRQEILHKITESKLTYYLQIARGTTATKRTIHLQSILDILGLLRMDISQFFAIKVPTKFIDSLNSSDKSSKPKLIPTCQAPWCENFGIPDSLLQTTSKNVRKATGLLTSYYICYKCGCEYAIDDQDLLVERTHFIHSYNVLCNRSLSKLTWHEREKAMGIKRNRINRIQAYFYVRGMFVNDINKSNYQINQMKLLEVLDAIKTNEEIYNIQHWKSWRSDEEYLLYRYHPDVMKELLNQKFSSFTEQKDNSSFINLVEMACEKLIIRDVGITLPIVSAEMNISATTIQNMGAAFVIAKYSKKQKEEHNRIEKECIIKDVKRYFAIHGGQRVHSHQLFKGLSICRHTIQRKFPELIKQINCMREEWNTRYKNIA